MKIFNFRNGNRSFAGRASVLHLVALLLIGCSSDPPALEAKTTIPPSNLPDPLIMSDGSRVRSRSEWVHKRRPELQRLFAEYMYGRIPPKPEHTSAKVVGDYDDFLDGQARLKLVRLDFDFKSSGRSETPLGVDLMLILPKNSHRVVPIFLAMNFCGNHALTSDPRVPLTRSWMGKSCPGCSNNAATEAARGTQATNWPLSEIVRRGYGLAAFYSGDIDSDRADVSSGLYAHLAQGDPNRNNPTNRGTIAAWAWGFQRCVDYLVTEPAVDRHRIAAVGHSRNSKTALLAAAFDERIAIAFPHQAGCGGSAPSRGTNGESVKAINDHFPHWFNAEFKTFNDYPEKLPFDQNCLVALCAPRPVLFSAATGDQWSNPAGQFEVLQAAAPVYHLLGVKGIETATMPPLYQLAGERLGYYVREGKHSMTPSDWKVFMDFADKQWRH